MTEPEQAAAGADDPVIAAEPTIEDRFATLTDDLPEGGAADPEELAGTEEAGDDDEAEIPPIEAPASWTAEEQGEFSQLPRALQRTLTRREAEREKAVQAKAREASQARCQAEGEARAVIQRMQDIYAARIQALLPAIPDRPSYQLQADDPRAFGEKMDAHESAVAQHQWAQQQLQALQQDRAAAEQAARAQDVQREVAVLRETLPEWFDEAEGPRLHERAGSIASELGYSAEQLHDATANEISALVKAGEWKAKADKLDALMAKKMETVRAAKGMPRVSKPGVPQAKAAIANQRYTADRHAMKNGDRDATTRVFKAFI
jgi:hypothetical protein